MIPNIIHFIWVGGSLPSKYYTNIQDWAKKNPKYDIWLWMDSGLYSTDEEGKPQVGLFDDVEANSNSFLLAFRKMFTDKKIQIQDLAKNGFLNEMKNGNFFLDETLGVKRNFGAASDILRVEILLKHGGVYLDTDSYPMKQLPAPMYAKHGVLLSYFYSHDKAAGAWCNAVIASEPGNALLQHMRNRIAGSYGRRYGLNSSPSVVTKGYFETKKKFEARKKKNMREHDDKINEKIQAHRDTQRVDSTLVMTGPGMVSTAVLAYMEDHPEDFDQTQLGPILFDPTYWKDAGYIFPTEYVRIESENSWV